MDSDYWLRRWREGRTGWHEAEGSPALRDHLAALELGPGRRVLVPLCGKTHDLAVLAQTGAAVVGCELAESAAEAFFSEHGLTPERRGGATGLVLSAGGVDIVVGDFFAQTPAALGRFEAVFDRAATVALPPDLRPRYARTVAALAAPGARLLVVTFEHDAGGDEPPFSVAPDEVTRLYPGASVERLGGADLFEPGGNLAARGATFTRESRLLLRV